MSTATDTPNVVIEDPKKRRRLNVIISTAAAVVGTAMVVDWSAPEFDISRYTTPVAAALLYIASTFNVTVSLPNTPRR